eukprot:TRINITY_DN9781_c0_g1_i1.p1 TRINITY_DN9781_c0_g1~~TRINITY_DN9781_c0_g1_i1.p1  ORF type:complete len:372 (-),score=71.88 TRINITY_DN9781_c0_g1_i1:41-1156(-)
MLSAASQGDAGGVEAGAQKLAPQASQNQQRVASLPLPLGGQSGASSSSQAPGQGAPPSPLRPVSAISRAGAEVAGVPSWSSSGSSPAGGAGGQAPALSRGPLARPTQQREPRQPSRGRLAWLSSALRFFGGNGNSGGSSSSSSGAAGAEGMGGEAAAAAALPVGSSGSSSSSSATPAVAGRSGGLAVGAPPGRGGGSHGSGAAAMEQRGQGSSGMPSPARERRRRSEQRRAESLADMQGAASVDALLAQLLMSRRGHGSQQDLLGALGPFGASLHGGSMAAFQSNEQGFQAALEQSRRQGVLSALPCEHFAPDQHKELVECELCLEEYEEGAELLRLPCMHLFHKACVGTWVEKAGTCPMCQVDVCLAAGF